MDAFRLTAAAVFAVAAASRLVLWRWHVRRDMVWLAKRFGASCDDSAIAEAHNIITAAILAGVSAVALYA